MQNWIKKNDVRPLALVWIKPTNQRHVDLVDLSSKPKDFHTPNAETDQHHDDEYRVQIFVRPRRHFQLLAPTEPPNEGGPNPTNHAHDGFHLKLLSDVSNERSRVRATSKNCRIR